MTSEPDRLQYHAQKFYESSAPDVVLNRYASRAETMSNKDLIRHVFHVCAWITLAHPVSDAARRTSATALSPIIVLTKMLGGRGGALLDDRAHTALLAVRSCCRLVLGMDSCEHRLDWENLQTLLLRVRKRKRGQIEDDLVASCTERVGEKSDIWMFKRLHRLNRRICKWNSFDFKERQEVASDLVRRFTEMMEEVEANCLQLRSLLYEVAAALSPPKARAQRNNYPQPLDDLAAEQLRLSARTQNDVRRLMLQGIALWRDRLQLEDEQIEPILSHVRYCIQRFEEQHGDVHAASAGRQWVRLKTALGCAAAGPAASQGRKQAGRATRKRGGKRTTSGGVYNPSQLVRSLRCVKQVVGGAMKLFCATCHHSITSDWYIELSNGVVRLLVPHAGHKVGGLRCGKYKPEVTDTMTRMDTMLPGLRPGLRTTL